MRLGTCIALELAVVASAGAGAWIGSTQLTTVADHYLTTRTATAEPQWPTLARPEPLPAARLSVAIAALPPENIFGATDRELLAPIGAAAVTRMKLNRGGTSLSIRIDFANGARASFKPEQTFTQSDPRHEIAAYRVDRLLGLGHVAPCKEITLSVGELLAVADPPLRAYYSQRILDDAIIRGGLLHGEAQWWIPDIKLAAIGGQRIDEHPGRDRWIELLQVGTKIPPELRPLLEQLSQLVLFDVLIDNQDRWSGANTLMSPDGQLLYFMDNTDSFSVARFGHEPNVTALRRIAVFSRRLVARLRKLTYSELEATFAVGSDSKLGPLLNAAEVHAILLRRDNMMAYIDGLIARHGESAVLAFP